MQISCSCDEDATPHVAWGWGGALITSVDATQLTALRSNRRGQGTQHVMKMLRDMKMLRNMNMLRSMTMPGNMKMFRNMTMLRNMKMLRNMMFLLMLYFVSRLRVDAELLARVSRKMNYAE